MNNKSETLHLQLDSRFPCISDLEKAARKRMPKFAFDYLQGGIGRETALHRNRIDLDAIRLRPHHITQCFEPQLQTRLFDQTYSAPFGIAPLGLSGLIWPNAATLLARTSKKANIPFILSTVATTSLETIAREAPQTSWFQLYIPNDQTINKSLIERAKASGYQTLVVTVDVPALGRRDRDIRNGLAVPPKISLTNIIQAAMCPSWSLQTLANGMPEFENLKQYVPPKTDLRSSASYISALSRGHVSPERLQQVRDMWPGNLLVKGILNEQDAKTAKDIGCDGIIVSNHGGRQLDSVPSTAQTVSQIRQSVGKTYPVLVDSGVRNGLDIARMLASGADFVFLGRGFAYGVAALGQKGADHVHHILSQELKNTMSQLGCPTPDLLPRTLIS